MRKTHDILVETKAALPALTASRERKNAALEAIASRLLAEQDAILEANRADVEASRSKYGEVYGLFDTALCFYIFVKGRAYYILPKDAVSGGESEELQKFLQKKCKKHFQHFDLTEGKGACA